MNTKLHGWTTAVKPEYVLVLCLIHPDASAAGHDKECLQDLVDRARAKFKDKPLTFVIFDGGDEELTRFVEFDADYVMRQDTQDLRVRNIEDAAVLSELDRMMRGHPLYQRMFAEAFLGPQFTLSNG